jgi:Tat protein translocase TatB subunit
MEIMVVAVVALIVFGPSRLPEIARTIGRTLNELRRQAADIRAEFETGLDDADALDIPPTADAEPSVDDEVPLDGAGPAEPALDPDAPSAGDPPRERPSNEGGPTEP